jgi:hypothetical protein
MNEFSEEANGGKAALLGILGDPIERGAGQIIQQAIDAELATLLERYGNVTTLDGRQAVVHNGYLPEREVVTAIGPVLVKVAEGTRPFRLECKVQFEHCATLHQQVIVRVGGAAVALSARHVDPRYEQDQ